MQAEVEEWANAGDDPELDAARAAATASPIEAARVRAVVESVTPQVDGGRFPAKRVLGDTVVVEADCFADGHDTVLAALAWRRADAAGPWCEAPMQPVGNDRWRGTFAAEALGRYDYRVIAWVDHFASWQRDLARRVDPEDIRLAALAGTALLSEAAERADGADRVELFRQAAALETAAGDPAAVKKLAADPDLTALATRYPDRQFAAAHAPLALVVDPPRARFGAWYELFPRSASPEPGRHGTFRDVEARLEYVEKLGFDVLYLPPIHPIGRERRKGPNNTLVTGDDDPGSPWAIGAREGGHKAIHPELGTREDFRRLVAAARERGIEIALDIAFQCAPDHPYVQAHPEWFKRRPDGSVQYAENPPKKYQDIYPFDFESADWAGLWDELLDVFLHWCGEGVRIFRVDNPHTKAFPFWEWVIGEVKDRHPDALFLSEAFTRPRVMHRLAKLGFSQSYTYFAWRNTREELEDYFTELAHGPGRDYFRPNVWPNTPDILTEHLQFGGRAAFVARLVLAATLSASYGIYGPAFELMEHLPREPGAEEYLDSEKYEIRRWDLEREDSLAPLVARVNAIRRENPALHDNASLAFLPTDNDQLIAYTKRTEDRANIVLTVVNLDPHHPQSGWITIEAGVVGADRDTGPSTFQVHDLITGARYLWSAGRNFVSLDPARSPAHVFRIRRRTRTEHDFDYFL